MKAERIRDGRTFILDSDKKVVQDLSKEQQSTFFPDTHLMLTLQGHVPKQYHNPVSQDHSHHLGSAPEFIKPRVIKVSASLSFESDQSLIAPWQVQQKMRASVSFYRTCHVYSSAIPHWGHLSSTRLFALGFLSEHFHMKASFYSAFILLCFHNDTP